MCRPRSQDGIETPMIAASQEAVSSLFMPREKDSHQLAKNKLPSYGDISPTKIVSWNQATSVLPKHFKSRAHGGKPEKIFAKIDKNGKKSRPIIVVQHDYHDYSHEEEMNHPVQQKSRGGVSTPFPLKLHEMLDKAMAEGYGDIVSWQPHGRCFVVYKPQDFQEIVLPKFFKLSKLSSFQRQLNLYGFQRLTFGRDRGGYYHERFLRHKEFLSRGIKRVQVKGTGVRGRSNPDQEPNFWTMKWCDPKVITNNGKSENKVVNSIDGTNRGMLSTWNHSFSTNQSQSNSQQDPTTMWNMEWCDPKFAFSSSKNGSMSSMKNASFSYQGQSNSELEPNDVWATEWCDPKFGAPSSKNVCTSFDGTNRGTASMWNAPASSQNRNGQIASTLPIPKGFQSIDTTRQYYSTPSLFGNCGGSPNYKSNGKHQGSYGGSVCTKAEEASDNLDPLKVFSLEENTNYTNNGIPDDLFERTLEQVF